MQATSRSETHAPAGRPVRRYVAMGDSFTAGAGDGSAAAEGDSPTAGAGARGTLAPWPDQLAARLRAESPGLDYLNLAVPGARSSAVARDQLERALALRPDLVTLVCGANDVLLSSRPDIEAYAANLAAMLAELRGSLPGAAILTATTPDFAGFLGLRERSRRRVAESMSRLAEATRLVARHHGVACLELAAHPQAANRGNFARDGYHPSVEGHRRAAAAFCAALRADFGIAVPQPGPEEPGARSEDAGTGASRTERLPLADGVVPL